MRGAARAEVRVTRGEDGTILITAMPASDDAGAYDEPGAVAPDFTRAVLDVAGATLTWPVLGTPGPPAAEVHDPGRAQQWLWALYGERVAAAVHDCGEEGPGGGRAVEPGDGPAAGPDGDRAALKPDGEPPAEHVDSPTAVDPSGNRPAAKPDGTPAPVHPDGDRVAAGPGDEPAAAEPGDGPAPVNAEGDRTAVDPRRRAVSAEPTALAGAAARLGLGHWAARWWPASYQDGIPALEPDLLGLELAALTHRCQQLFDEQGDQPDDCVAELIEEHRAALDPLVGWWQDAPQPAGLARHLESVLRLVDDAADSTGLDGPALRRLRSSLDRHRPSGAPVDPGALFSRPGGYALAAGEPPVGGGRLIARGTGTNDWRRCPPGLVDASENAVSWTARALGARRRIEVEAVAHGAAPTAGVSLFAEVRVNGGSPHRVPLTRRDDVWTGGADLSAELSAGLPPPRVEVGVLLPGFDPGPGGTPDAADDREARDAVRALVRRRLTAATRPSAYDGSPHDTPSAPFLAETAAPATDEDY